MYHGLISFPDKLSSFCNTRKEDTVLNRLHIAHSNFTHFFLLRKEEAPVRVACNAVFTVKHILIECADFFGDQKEIFRREIFVLTFFRNVFPEIIFDFP